MPTNGSAGERDGADDSEHSDETEGGPAAQQGGPPPTTQSGRGREQSSGGQPHHTRGQEQDGQPQQGQAHATYGQEAHGQPPQHGEPGPGRGHQQPSRHQQATTSTGLDENVAAALSYLLGWITGLLFYFIEDDNEYIRFHAMQSILLSVAFIVGYFALIFSFGIFFTLVPGGGLVWAFMQLLSLAGLALVVLLMIKAYNGEWFMLPVIGDIARDKAPPSRSQPGQSGGSSQGHQYGGQRAGSQQGGQMGSGQPGGYEGGQQSHPMDSGTQGGHDGGQQDNQPTPPTGSVDDHQHGEQGDDAAREDQQGQRDRDDQQ